MENLPGKPSSLNFEVLTKNDLNELSNRDLAKLTRELQKSFKRLKIENEIFEHFLQENDNYIPGPFISSYSHINYAKSKELSQRASSTLSFGNTGSLGQLLTGKRINFEEKMELTALEREKIKKDMKKFKKNFKRQMNDLSVQLESYKLDYDDIQTTKFQFEKLISSAISVEINQKFPAEKFVKFLRDWQRSAHSFLEKLRIKVNNQRVLLRKLKEQYDIKEPLHLIVNEVDIFVLKLRLENIKNDLKLKNDLWMTSKSMLTKSNLSIMEMRNTVKQQLNHYDNLEEQIKTTNSTKNKYAEEEEKLISQLENMSKKHDQVEHLIQCYSCPSVHEYLMAKHQLRCLNQQLKKLKEKSSIQNHALSCYKALLRQYKSRNCGEALAEWDWINISSSNISVWSSSLLQAQSKGKS